MTTSKWNLTIQCLRWFWTDNGCLFHLAIVYMPLRAWWKGVQQNSVLAIIARMAPRRAAASLWLVRPLLLLPCLKVIAKPSYTQLRPPPGSLLYHTRQSGRRPHTFTQLCLCFAACPSLWGKALSVINVHHVAGMQNKKHKTNNEDDGLRLNAKTGNLPSN